MKPHSGGNSAGVCYEDPKVSVWGLEKKVKATRQQRSSLFRGLPSPRWPEALMIDVLFTIHTSAGISVQDYISGHLVGLGSSTGTQSTGTGFPSRNASGHPTSSVGTIPE